MADETERIVIEFLAQTQNALQNVEKLKQATAIAKEAIRRDAKDVGASFKEIATGMQFDIKAMKPQAMGDLFKSMNLPLVVGDVKAVAQAKQLMGQAIRNATTELNAEKKALDENKSATSGVGDVVKMAFGVGIGQIATQAIRNFINILKEAVEMGYEFVKSIFQLEIGVRALRRAGLDIATQDILNNLDMLRQKFGVFSQKELVQGQAQLLNLVRDMGFTKEQIFGLTDAVATLAIVNGRSMEEVQRTVALALSSGYTEGLQRLGVSINRVTIAQKAATMGYADSYMALTEVERAAATYALILEKTAKYSSDLAEYQNTLVGAIDATTARITDQTAAIGTQLTPIKMLGNYLKEAFYNVILMLLPPMAMFINELAALFRIFSIVDWNKPLEAFKQIGPAIDTARKQIADFNKGIVEAYNTGNWTKFAEMMSVPFKGEATVEIAGLTDEQSEKMKEEVADLYSDISKLERDYQRDQRDAQIDYFRDIDKINRDTFAKQMDAYDDFLKKKKEKEKDINDQIGKLTEKYNLDVLQVNRQFATKMAESEAKYREKQIKAELDYQEKLRKMREGFLFDLEDALHERDARQILRLVRQYNLEKDQANRDYKLKQDEMARERVLEIQEMENARNERLQVLAEELALRISQIQAQAAAEIETERQTAQAKMDEIAAAAEREKEERKIKLGEVLADLSTHLQDRYDELLIKFGEENKLTAEMLDQQMRLYEEAYGPNGRLERAVQYAIAQIQAISAAISAISNISWPTMSPMQQINKPLNQANTTRLNPIRQVNEPYAEGGSMIASAPTSVVFGDAGPEMATFTPLNRIGKNEGTMSMGNMASLGGGGEVGILVTLSPDLEGRIMNDTLGKVANVMLEVQRKR